jgi:hypothetical protein
MRQFFGLIIIIYLGPFPNKLKWRRLVVENGRLRRRELRVLPKFAAFEALAPDAFVFGRHRGGWVEGISLQISCA